MDEKQEITLSALSPVFQDKTFIGVMVSDVKLNTFNQFLSELKQRMNADVYVMDKQHRLIAHSGEGSVVSWGTPLSPKGERLFASENRNPIIRSSAEQLDLQGLNVGTLLPTSINSAISIKPQPLPINMASLGISVFPSRKGIS